MISAVYNTIIITGVSREKWLGARGSFGANHVSKEYCTFPAEVVSWCHNATGGMHAFFSKMQCALPLYELAQVRGAAKHKLVSANPRRTAHARYR